MKLSKNVIIFNPNNLDSLMGAAIVALKLKQVRQKYQLVSDVQQNIEEYPSIPIYEKYDFRLDSNLFIVGIVYPVRWLDYWRSIGISIRLFNNALNDDSVASLVWKSLYSNRRPPEIIEHIKCAVSGFNAVGESYNRKSEAIYKAMDSIQSRCNSLENQIESCIEFIQGHYSIEELEAVGNVRLNMQRVTGAIMPR